VKLRLRLAAGSGCLPVMGEHPQKVGLYLFNSFEHIKRDLAARVKQVMLSCRQCDFQILANPQNGV
jgi:hypothetical protein